MTKKFEMSMRGELAYFFLGEDTNGSSKQSRSDLAGKLVNETLYRGMIGSLMYLKGTPSFGLYYPKFSGFDLKGYSDLDYAGCNTDRKSTSAKAKYVVAAGLYSMDEKSTQ
ncbi:hypothetical protein Tco_0120522 [Tanacetum coccineum]